MAGIIDSQQFIAAIKELSQTYAVDVLKRPVNKDSFEYGLHCGTVQGLAKAEELYLKLLNDGDESGKQRPRPQRPY